jgi:hypothetical protein
MLFRLVLTGFIALCDKPTVHHILINISEEQILSFSVTERVISQGEVKTRSQQFPRVVVLEVMCPSSHTWGSQPGDASRKLKFSIYRMETLLGDPECTAVMGI